MSGNDAHERKGSDGEPTPSSNKYQTPRDFAAADGLDNRHSAHFGSLDARKRLKGSLHPKYFERHALMKLTRKVKDLRTGEEKVEGFLDPRTGEKVVPVKHNNQTVFSSLIGAAIAGQDFCPIWKLTPIKEASGEITLGVRTKFIEDFGSLQDAETSNLSALKKNLLYELKTEVRGQGSTTLKHFLKSKEFESELHKREAYGYFKLNSVKPEVLSEKKLPLFFALAKILGNGDIPARNVGHHGKNLHDRDQHFFMSDVDQSGHYWELTPETINRPLNIESVSPTTAPPAVLASPYVIVHAVGLSIPIPEKRSGFQEFKACEEKMALNQSAVNQHFQALLAAVLLPDDWIESLPRKYLAEDTENFALIESFKTHRSGSIERGLMASEQFKTALSDEAIKRRWMEEILFNFARLNVQEYRTTVSTAKEPSIPIDLKQVTQKLNYLCVTMGPPPISDLEKNRLIRKTETQAAHAFLKDKAIQYLSKLDRRFFRIKKMKGLPKHAQKIIGLLKTGAADWPAIQRELKEVIQSKPFKRDPKTQAAYVALFNHLNRVLPSLPSQEASSETMRSSTPVMAYGAGAGLAGAGSEAKPESMRGGSPPTGPSS